MLKKINPLLLILSLSLFLSGCNNDDDDAETENISNAQALEYLAKPTEWLFMFYLGGDNNLEQFLLQDIEEIRGSDYNPDKIKSLIIIDRSKYPTDSDFLGKRSTTKFLLLTINDGHPQLHEIALPELNLVPGTETELNMGDINTFTEFIKYSKTIPAEKYALFFGSHGSSWWNEFYDEPESSQISNKLYTSPKVNKAVIYDDTKPDNQTSNLTPALDIDDLGRVLEDYPVDIVGFDACSMGSIEVAYALRKGSKYMVGSIDMEPAEGWNYQLVINTFAQGGSALTLGKNIVDGYKDYYKDWDYVSTSITMALINLDAFSENNFQDLFSKNGQYSLLDRLPINSSLYMTIDVPKLGTVTEGYLVQFDISYLFSDVIGLDTATKSSLQSFLDELIIYKHTSHPKYSGLSGIGISVIPNIELYKTNYQSLAFWKETAWGQYITRLYN